MRTPWLVEERAVWKGSEACICYFTFGIVVCRGRRGGGEDGRDEEVAFEVKKGEGVGCGGGAWVEER